MMQFTVTPHRLHGLCLHMVQMPTLCSLNMTMTASGLRQGLLLVLHIDHMALCQLLLHVPHLHGHQDIAINVFQQ